MAEDTSKKGRSLLDFERAKRRAACPVCSLPDAMLNELRAARAKKIPQNTVLEWLKTERGITLSRQEFLVHGAAHHEAWLEDSRG